MNITLSCGPVIEPLIAVAISIIICVIVCFYIVKRIKSSDYFNNDFKLLSKLRKSAIAILFLIIVIASLWLFFFIVALIVAGVLFALGK